MSEQLYSQCRLEKKVGEKYVVTFTWIPKQFAQIGKFLKLKDDDGWQVTHIWETQTESQVKARERLYAHWREKTDI